MIERLATHLLLRPEDVPPSHPDWEVIGVFNPGVVRHGDDNGHSRPRGRAAARAAAGLDALIRVGRPTRATSSIGCENEHLDGRRPARDAASCRPGLVRLTFISHLRVFRSRDGRTIDKKAGPLFLPANEMEEFGLEDPRITRLDDRYYITYVAVSRHGPATALASTTDFKTLERHGIIFCPENKDVVLLPARVGGEYVALHRPLGDMPFCRPEMWIARSPDLVHWGDHRYLVWRRRRLGRWPRRRRRAAARRAGRLARNLSRQPPTGSRRRSRRVLRGAMLLAKDDPGRVLKVSREPILEPQL